jgi:hypothetical protein
MKTRMVCDPPSGWKYGFPKPVPKQFDTTDEFHDWLVSEGYPMKEIESYGDHFYCRYWEEEVSDE